MSTHPAELPRTADPAEAALLELEQAVGRLAQLARSEPSAETFYRALLKESLRALAAEGGAVWLCQQGQLQVCQWSGSPNTAHWSDEQSIRQRRAAVGRVIEAGGPEAVALQQDDDAAAGSVSDRTIFVASWQVAGQWQGAVEVLPRTGSAVTSRHGCLEFLSAMAEIASGFEQQRQLRYLQERQQLWHGFAEFVAQIHARLDLDHTAYAIANEGRRLWGCDRASVVVARGRDCRLQAVSGVDQIDRRAEETRRLQQLARTVVRSGSSLWHDATGDDLHDAAKTAAPLDRALHAYLDAAASPRMLGVVPLVGDGGQREPGDQSGSTPAAIGALVVEVYESSDAAAVQRKVEATQAHVTAALRNATEYHWMPLGWLSRMLSRIGWFVTGRRLPKTLVVASVVVAACAALWLVPAELRVEARGKLQPQLRRDVFAPADGVIQDLLVQDGQTVAAGQPLLQVRDPHLELQLRQVEGELRTVEQQLASAEAARVGERAAGTTGSQQYQQLISEMEQLKQQRGSLQRQQEILLDQKKELTVYSPIAGRVLSWELHSLLAARPVARGENLLTIGDVAGPWVAEVQVPDAEIGFVTSAQQGQENRQLLVSLVVASRPDQTYPGQILEVAPLAETDRQDRTAVEATVALDRAQLDQPRPGATVIAKIHCGRHSIGYVWFRGLIAWMRTHVLF